MLITLANWLLETKRKYPGCKLYESKVEIFVVIPSVTAPETGNPDK